MDNALVSFTTVTGKELLYIYMILGRSLCRERAAAVELYLIGT